MKKLAIAFAFASSVVLAGCGTVPNNGPGPVAPAPTPAQEVSDIQKWAKVICGITPYGADILDVLLGPDPIRGGAKVIAGIICNAVFPKSLTGQRKRASAPMVNGVVIRWKYAQ